MARTSTVRNSRNPIVRKRQEEDKRKADLAAQKAPQQSFKAGAGTGTGGDKQREIAKGRERLAPEAGRPELGPTIAPTIAPINRPAFENQIIETTPGIPAEASILERGLAKLDPVIDFIADPSGGALENLDIQQNIIPGVGIGGAEFLALEQAAERGITLSKQVLAESAFKSAENAGTNIINNNIGRAGEGNPKTANLITRGLEKIGISPKAALIMAGLAISSVGFGKFQLSEATDNYNRAIESAEEVGNFDKAEELSLLYAEATDPFGWLSISTWTPGLGVITGSLEKIKAANQQILTNLDSIRKKRAFSLGEEQSLFTKTRIAQEEAFFGSKRANNTASNEEFLRRNPGGIVSQPGV